MKWGKTRHRSVSRPYKEHARVVLDTATVVVVYVRLSPHQDVSCGFKLCVIGGEMRKVFG